MECHKGWGGPNTPEGWDSGNTPAMKEATDHYNDALIGLIAKLVKTYYPNKWIEENQIKNYISGLYAVHDFEQLAHNPTGEYQGTIAMLDAPAHVSSDLETMVCDMVKAITSDDSRFSYKAWKKRWDQATKAGD